MPIDDTLGKVDNTVSYVGAPTIPGLQEAEYKIHEHL